MILEAGFRQFPGKTLRKLAVSGRNLPENVKNSTQKSDNSIRSPEYHGMGRFPVGLFELG